jgi:hypothetical protein
MNRWETETLAGDSPLPDTQHELELLLEALNALNEVLDQHLEDEAIET